MKKFLSFVVLLFIMIVFVGCNQPNEASQPTSSTSPQLQVTDHTTAPPTEPTTAPTTPPFNPALLLAQISEEELEQMRTDYVAQFYPSGNIDPQLLNFTVYGLWDHTYALFVTCSGGGSGDVLTFETVNDLTFVYPNANTMRVYAEGAYHTLTDAFVIGYLSKAELETLYQNYYSIHPHLQNYA